MRIQKSQDCCSSEKIEYFFDSCTNSIVFCTFFKFLLSSHCPASYPRTWPQYRASNQISLTLLQKNKSSQQERAVKLSGLVKGVLNIVCFREQGSYKICWCYLGLPPAVRDIEIQPNIM